MTRLLRIMVITIAGFALMVAIFVFMLIAGGSSEAAPQEPATTTAVASEVHAAMMLDVFHIEQDAGLEVAIPLATPETS